VHALAIVLAQAAGAPALPPPPTLTPARASAAPTIDGDLSDDVWQAAPATEAFTQKFPDERAAPTERTTLRVLYDDEALYVAFDCDQRHSPIVARMARRDREVESDAVSIAIDSRALGKTAFEMVVNAAGVLRDGIRSNDITEPDSGNRFNPSWDENWDARTKIRADGTGWSAELRIPLRILRFSPGSVQTWGFQARRYVSMRQETDEWAFVPRNVSSEVAIYGRLANMRMRPKSELELRPFALARIQRRDPNDVALDAGWSLRPSAGLDLRWHITPDLTLDGTANPDFTQVEGDELYLNLTNFENYFPEKRPFFVEGAEIFESPAPLFYARAFQVLYTRRIGRRPAAPALRPSPLLDERLVSLPEAQTILGATKLVGRLAPGWSVGAMSAATAPSTVEVQDASGRRQDRVADPATSYQVVRVKHDLAAGRAHVGFLGTAVSRAERAGLAPVDDAGDGLGPRALCADGTRLAIGRRCTHDAYVGSLDGVWRSKDGEIAVTAQGIASLVKHGPPRTLRDGTVIEDGDAGWGTQVTAAREGGSGLAWNVQHQFASRKLDFNDLGYMERQNQHFYYGNLEYRTFEPWLFTVETKSYVEVFGRYALDGTKLGRRWLVDSVVRYTNLWSSYFELNYEEPRLDDRETSTGSPFERPGRPGLILQLGTDRRRRLFFETTAFAQKIPDGSNVETRLRALVRAHPQLEIELIPSLTYTSGETRFAARTQAPNTLLFGALEAASFATTMRVNLAITPRLALQTFGQVFLAAGHYDDFRTFTGSGAPRETIRLAALVPTAAPAESPDFRDVSLNVNVVLRWEYGLGSILYLVYNRSQTPATQVTLTEPATLSFVPLGRAPAIDTLLLKWQLFVDL